MDKNITNETPPPEPITVDCEDCDGQGDYEFFRLLVILKAGLDNVPDTEDNTITNDMLVSAIETIERLQNAN